MCFWRNIQAQSKGSDAQLQPRCLFEAESDSRGHASSLLPCAGVPGLFGAVGPGPALICCCAPVLSLLWSCLQWCCIASERPSAVLSMSLSRAAQLARASLLQRISVPVGQLSIPCGPWARSFADSTFLDKEQVTERILGVASPRLSSVACSPASVLRTDELQLLQVKNFDKVDGSKVWLDARCC